MDFLWRFLVEPFKIKKTVCFFVCGAQINDLL